MPLEGWQAISRHAGVPVEDLKQSAARGDLPLMAPRIKRRHLDRWARRHRLLAQIVRNQRIEVVPDLGQPLDVSGVLHIRVFTEHDQSFGGITTANTA